MKSQEKHTQAVEETIRGFWKTIPPLWHYTRAAIHRNAREDFGITSTQYHVLRRIKEDGKKTVSELSGCMFVSRPNISRAVEDLANAGLIERERDINDRRVVYLSATPAGQSMIERIYTKNNIFLQGVFSPLADEELAAVQNAFDILEKILINNI
jgi:DNA-binding MarR family transcriptional regulator